MRPDDASGIVKCNLLQVAFNEEWARIHMNGARHNAHTIRPHNAVIVAVEGHAHF